MSHPLSKIKQLDKKRVKKHLIKMIQQCDPFNDFEVDNDGQLVLFTGLFLWDDFTIRTNRQSLNSLDNDDDDTDDHPVIEEEFKFDNV